MISVLALYHNGQLVFIRAFAYLKSHFISDKWLTITLTAILVFEAVAKAAFIAVEYGLLKGTYTH